jgi:hypothetical protein
MNVDLRHSQRTYVFLRTNAILVIYYFKKYAIELFIFCLRRLSDDIIQMRRNESTGGVVTSTHGVMISGIVSMDGMK